MCTCQKREYYIDPEPAPKVHTPDAIPIKWKLERIDYINHYEICAIGWTLGEMLASRQGLLLFRLHRVY